MTDYETQLRDEFAKIAFDKLVNDWVQNPFNYKSHEGLGKWAYDLANQAMQARKDPKQ